MLFKMAWKHNIKLLISDAEYFWNDLKRFKEQGALVQYEMTMSIIKPSRRI